MPLPTYLMSNFPSVRPSLNLQFDSQPTPEDMTSHLASVGATFSRASIGTYTDANGLIQEASAGQARPNYSSAGVHEGLLIEESRTNILKSSEDFSTTDWEIFSNTLKTNQIVAPDGKASADLLTSTGANAFPYIRDFISVTSGNDVTFSLFVKQYSTDDQVVIRLVGTSLGTGGTDTSSNYKFTFSTEALTKISGGTAKSTFVEDYGNGWYRIGITLDNATITQAVIYPIFNSTTVSSVYIWGAQLEEGSFPTSYIPTIPTFSSRASTATYFDSSGVLQTQAIQTSPTGVGRIDHKYIDGQWVEAGLLLEGASTNLVLQSEDFSTTWTESANANLTVNQAVAPDGTTTADELEDTAVNSVFTVSQDVTTVATTQYTASVFVKPNTKNFVYMYAGGGPGQGIIFDLLNVTTGSNVGNAPDSARIERYGDYYRCEFTFTATDGSTSISVGLANSSSVFTYLGDGAGSVYIWGAQVEAQSQATSYIKTTTASADRDADSYTTATKERSADVCYIDGTAFTDFYNQEQGTWYSNIIASGNSKTILDADSPSVDRFPQLGVNATDKIQSSFVSFNDYTVDTISEGDELKISVTVTDGAQRNFYNGEFKEETTVANPKDLNIVYIGIRDVGISILNGSIKKLIYFPRALSDNELIKLTR